MRKRFFSVDVLKNNASHFADENALRETREEKHSVHLTVVRESRESPFRRVDIVVVPPRHWVFAVLGWTGTTFFERTIRSYVDGKFTDATCHSLEHRSGNVVAKPNRYRENDPKFRIQWKLNNKMLVKVKMCGSKCIEIVNDGTTSGRPDFNTEQELFKFLGLEYLPPHEREM